MEATADIHIHQKKGWSTVERIFMENDDLIVVCGFLTFHGWIVMPNGLVIWEVNFLGCQWTHKTISCCSSVPSILGVDNFDYPFMDFPHFRIFLRKKSLCWLHPLCLDNSGLLGGRRFSNFACWKVGAEPCNTSGCGFLISVDWFKGKSERKPWFLPAFSILVYSMYYLAGGFTTLKTNE